MGAAFLTCSCSSTERNLTGMMAELESEGLNCYMCAGIPKNPVKYGTALNPNDSAVHGITACYECIFMNAIESLGEERSLEGRVAHRSVGQGFDCGYCRDEIRTIAIDPEKRRKIKELMEKYDLDSSDYATQSINDSYRSIPSILNDYHSGSRGWDWLYHFFGEDTRTLAEAVGISPDDIPWSFEPVDRERLSLHRHDSSYPAITFDLRDILMDTGAAVIDVDMPANDSPESLELVDREMLSSNWTENIDRCGGAPCPSVFLHPCVVLLLSCLFEFLLFGIIMVLKIVFPDVK